MAKITTITNPLTGQPAQVDQLDHTAQQIDDGLNIARNVSNPNLLDNWYFGNPVDQRGGYVVPPGTTVYEGDFTTSAGTTDKYYTLQPPNSVSGGNYYFGFNDKVAYVKPENVVRGYTGAGYGIDRWKIDGTSYMTIGDNKITFGNTNADYSAFKQIIENPSQYIGKTLTFSVLGRAISGSPSTFIPYHGTVALKNELSVVSHTFVFGSTPGEDMSNLQVNVWGNNTVSSVELIAAKLELGDTQTLAHQDSSSNWVLNELPVYGEQLARCQRYFQTFATESLRHTDALDFRPVMRTNPALSTITVGGKTLYTANADL